MSCSRAETSRLRLLLGWTGTVFESAARLRRQRHTSLDEDLLDPGPGLAAWTAEVIAPERYDVVIKCLNGRLMVPWVTALTAVKGVPLVIWTGMWWHPETVAHRLTRRLTRAVYNRADAIAVYGSHVTHYLVSEEHVAPDKIVVVGQAVPRENLVDVERGDSSSQS